MTQKKTTKSEVFKVSNHFKGSAWVDSKKYEEMCRWAKEDPEGFWAEQGKRISWMKPWERVKNASFQNDIEIKWYEGAKLNASYNCVDRHLENKSNDVAIIWEPEDPRDEAHEITFQELHQKVCRWANVLKSQGVRKGDRVTIYMPMIPQAAFAMLACARIGAIHSVVFGGFSPDSLADRIDDCDSDFVITADEGKRNGKKIHLKNNVDRAAEKCKKEPTVLVYRYTGGHVDWNEDRDVWFHEAWKDAKSQLGDDCPPEKMDSEDPLFILYTSGSTNKPKGVLHTTGGYMVYTSLTFETIFDYRSNDRYWCSADVGWITGHSYMVYGPLANGATTLLFEGVPTWPDASRFWQVIDRHHVDIFYTAPTAIRALEKCGDEYLKTTSRKSLRILGTVGEPINTEAWKWYYEKVGHKSCPIVDTWWQTETGGILISPLPGATDLKPGSASKPFFGIEPIIVDDEGNELSGACQGNLCIKDSWPGQMRTVYKDHERFKQTYFSMFPGRYFTGDGAKRDEDGYYWITGRVDDVLNVSGHRLGTAEVESALDSHPQVVETAVVGYPHEIKGQGIYAFVTLMGGEEPSDKLKEALISHVREKLGPIAKPDLIQWAPSLPKTRSGKIMRRILRKIAESDTENLGDTSTLADPSVVEDLVKNRATS
jgi:acetyl-CoA synthetase